MDAIDRYNNKKSRVEKLEALQTEFREKITFQKKRKTEMEEMLQKLQQNHTTLASSRQVYQEVDSKDSALNAARRQCLESKEKDKRLQDSIESLRRFMPRLLAKVTKLHQPVPSIEQVDNYLKSIMLSWVIFHHFLSSFLMPFTS
jgi:chromosome segregation ATPase